MNRKLLPAISYPSLRTGTILLLFSWTLLLIFLTLLNFYETQQWIRKLAKVEAEASFNKDVLYRRWAARNGGLYVPPDKTEPNKYLSHIKTRDIVTTEGKKLTLVNPAYMTRMVHELGDSSNHTYKIKGHITAFNPVRPENKPDNWEQRALSRFNRGDKEVAEVLEYKNQTQLRFMKPILIEDGCIKCHDKFVGKVGQIGGGISVAVPLKLYEPAFASQIRTSILTYFLIWIFGVFFIMLGSRTISLRNQREAKLAKQLKLAQKMEAIGQLSGGIAHDFNNILSIIIGYTQLSIELAKKDTAIQEHLHQVLSASDRAKNLIGQLLLFSRKQSAEKTELDLNKLIADFTKLLQKGIPENIRISCKTDSELRPILADVTHIEQIIMNLVVNARDAMPDGGTVVIETVEKEIDSVYCMNNVNAREGIYNCIMVSDSGMGIAKENLDRIFDPFFSTKEAGKGTGLGLATVFGIVAQHSGFIEVYSEVGTGTTFRIYLPIMKERIEKRVEQSERTQKRKHHGSAVILVAEDDEMLAKLAQTILTRQGYTVLLAKDGDEAVALYHEHADEIDLLIFDLIMPKCGGIDAYTRITESRRNVPLIITSGYSGSIDMNTVIHDNSIPYIEKPYSHLTLLKAVDDALASKKD